MTKTRFAFGLPALVLLTAGSLTLSAQYGPPQRYAPPAANLISGTYDIDTTRGDDAQRAADMATRNLPPGQRDRAYQSLLGRLQPPGTLAIDRAGRTVTISSSNGPRASFDADGQRRNEYGPGGQLIQTHAEFIGNRLYITTIGNRNTDFVVTFEPLNNGDALLVTRRLDSDDLRGPVTIRSYYHRVDAAPRWDVYDRGRGNGYGNGGYGNGNPPPPPPPPPRAFMVPEGTRLSAVLDTNLSTRTSRNGERFVMTVESPAEYRGARINGTVARVTPYGQGRNADMAVDFDTMQLGNGQTAEFDAVINTVRTPGGVTLRVDNSGNVPDSNRNDNNVQNGALGAALGAIIGAIAGGGKGAAIGAIVGGAGGVIVGQDRDQFLDLPPGTQVTILVVAPRRRMP